MSETVTMTLTDFLLARIAERQADADQIHRLGCDATRDHPFPCNCGEPARVLAECEAKRAIVEHAACEACPPDYAIDWVLRVLSYPYADHPDYREEWRP